MLLYIRIYMALYLKLCDHSERQWTSSIHTKLIGGKLFNSSWKFFEWSLSGVTNKTSFFLFIICWIICFC